MAILPWGKKREALKKAEELLIECCAALNLPEKTFSPSGKDWISRRKWDDDFCDMRRVIAYAALLSPEDKIESEHFPPVCTRDHEAFTGKQFEAMALEEMVRQKVAHFFIKLGRVEAKGVHRTVINQVERPLIEECLKWANGNQLKAARVLGINRNTLRTRIRELKINKKREDRGRRHEA